jgi:hypothetical protein
MKFSVKPFCVLVRLPTPPGNEPPELDDELELLLELDELLEELDDELLLEPPVPQAPKLLQTPSGPELVAGFWFCVHHLA